MRVLIAHSFYRMSGGEDGYVRQQLDLLRRRHDVFLLDRYNQQLRGGTTSALHMLYSWRSRSSVEDFIRTSRPEVIHLHNAYPAFGPAVFLAASRLRIPLVLTVHNYRLRCPNGYQFTADSLCDRCERGAYHQAVLNPCFPTVGQRIAYASSLWIHRFVLDLEDKVSLFVCPSEFMLNTLMRWGIPRRKLKLIRNFTEPNATADSSPGEHGVYVGRLSREKGVHVLLRALRRAGDPPFTILGEGPESEELRRLASRLSLRNTRFGGHAPRGEVDEVLRRARFVVLPSLWNENAPLVALEAMARGRPLIVSSVGGLAELARGGAGCLVRAGDDADLARSMDLLIRDDETCRRTGTAALAYAQAELTPERHLTQLEEAYLGLLSGNQSS